MKTLFQRVLIAGVLGLAALAGASLAQPSGPPLLPGETYFEGPNGCGVILTQAQIAEVGGKEKLVKAYTDYGIFKGPCVDGLLHGKVEGGRLHYGRPIRYQNSTNGYVNYTTNPGVDPSQIESVAFNKVGPDLAPTWADPSKTSEITSNITIKRDGMTTTIWAWRISCISVKVPVRGCNLEKPATWFSVYSVEVAQTPYAPPGQAAKREVVHSVCPDFQNPATCEPLWRATLARYKPQIDDIIARAKTAEAEKILVLDDLNGALDPAKKLQLAAEREAREKAKNDAIAQAAADRIAAAELAEQEEADALNRAGRVKSDLAAAEAEAQATFRRKINAGNAGTLYALADELAEAGDPARAREAFRALVSRFPDHALAATAAQRLPALSGGSSASGGGGSASAARTSTPPRYSSVCVRNLQKTEDVLRKANASHAAASNDRWLINLNEIVVRLYQPCAGYDATAARDYKRAADEAARIRQYCSTSRGPTECTEWGYGAAEMNRNWFTIWNGEMQKAFANPNYSADLGTAAGPGGTVVGDLGQLQATAAKTSIGNPQAHEQCRIEMHRLGREMDRHRERIPAGQTVPLMELIIWHADAAARAIEVTCPTSGPYAGDRLSFLKTSSDALATCNKIATRTCSARLPD